MPNTVFLTPQQLVDRWAGVVTTGTLANWRSKREGPSFMKVRGRVVYPLSQVLAWEEKNMQVTAANDAGAELIGVAA